MNSPRHYTPRRQALRRLRRRLILETEAFLNQQLASGSPRPDADSITPEQVRCARQTPPEPMFFVWVWPWWSAAELVDLPGSDSEVPLDWPSPAAAANVAVGSRPAAGGCPPSNGASLAPADALPAVPDPVPAPLCGV